MNFWLVHSPPLLPERSLKPYCTQHPGHYKSLKLYLIHQANQIKLSCRLSKRSEEYYQFGVRLTNGLDGKTLITFNARNDHDRQKFVGDLKEAIAEASGSSQGVNSSGESLGTQTSQNLLVIKGPSSSSLLSSGKKGRSKGSLSQQYEAPHGTEV
ncbi:IQSEC [Mytilus edulis]|uniref:IQSEC n=1 Tax=Mytilus edulis TaxID=6550 RepID=A0A8S3SSS6_MYTED|nr:IQSEC [Mytilus edulis]